MPTHPSRGNAADADLAVWAAEVARLAGSYAEHRAAGRIAAATEAMLTLQGGIEAQRRQITRLYVDDLHDRPGHIRQMREVHTDEQAAREAAEPGSDHLLTGTPELPDAAAPTWVDGYLTGHDRGVAEGREQGYVEYEGHIRHGIAGMLAGDPAITDYRYGVRIHENSVTAKESREAWDRVNRLPDAFDDPGTKATTQDHAQVTAVAGDTADVDGRLLLSPPAQALIDGTTDAQAHELVAGHDDGWEL